MATKKSYIPLPEVSRAGTTDVGRRFNSVSQRNHNRTALIEGDKKVSYRELNVRTNRLANVMLAQGTGRGDRIALLARNCIPYVEVELAAAKIGAITVGLNWRSSQSELTHCLNLTEPTLIIATPEFEGVLTDIGSPPDLVVGGNYETAIVSSKEVEPDLQLDAEDGLVIIFTSGTTGLPKGALISHRAMIARTLIYTSEFKVPKDDTFVAWSPLFHMGSNDFTLATLLRGGQVGILDGYQPEQIIRVIENYSVHYLTVVPGMIDDFVNHLKRLNANPKHIGMVGAMADLVAKPLIIEITSLLNAPYLNTFGSTETGIPPATGNVVGIGGATDNLSKKQNFRIIIINNFNIIIY